jgi:8-oxo-dGTP pyrophosphatase MutT (NUDIX family)
MRDALSRVEHQPVAMEAKEASVLLPLFERDGEPYLVLTLRPDDMPTHAGQVAFPGGSREDTDSDLFETASRETEEEIGLDRKAIENLGLVGTVPTLGSTFIVASYAASIDPPERWTPSLREIAAIYEIPLSKLREVRTTEERERENVRFKMPLFEVDDVRVWGFTAFMLARFLDILDGAG